MDCVRPPTHRLLAVRTSGWEALKKVTLPNLAVIALNPYGVLSSAHFGVVNRRLANGSAYLRVNKLPGYWQSPSAG